MTDLPTSSAVPRHRAGHGDRRVAGRWRRVVPLLLVVGLLGACAPETVPQGLATSYLPPPPTTAPPTVVPTPTPTPTPTIAPTPASSPSPSPTDQAATDQAVDFVAGLETMAEEAGSYRLSGGGSFPDGDLVLDVRSQSDVDPPALDVTLATPGGPTTRTVLVDDDVYVQREDLTGPDEWLQASRNSPRLAEFVEEATQSARPFDLSTWREAATSVEVVGEQEGDNGVVLLRHRFTLDPARAAEAADNPRERASYESVPGAELSYDVWVDDRGFLRRVDYDFEGLALSFTFRGWGLDQGITAPDPAAIVTAPPDTGN